MPQEKETLATIPSMLPADLWTFKVAPLFDPKVANQFRLSYRFFHRASNTLARYHLIKSLEKERPEIKLLPLQALINNLNNPRKVHSQLLWLSQAVIQPLVRQLLHDICYEFNNPLLWFLLDDNTTPFFKRVNDSHDIVEFLPTAIALNSVTIVERILLNYRQYITKDLELVVLRAALFSGNLKMIDRLKNNNFDLSYREYELSFAVYSRNEAMVATVLANSSPADLDLDMDRTIYDRSIWSESIWGEAARSGVVKIMEHLFAYTATHGHDQRGLIPSVLYHAVESGNEAMVAYVESKKDKRFAPTFYHHIGVEGIIKSAAISANCSMYNKVIEDLKSIAKEITPFHIVSGAALTGNISLFEKVLKDVPQLSLSELELNNLLAVAASSGSSVMFNRLLNLIQAKNCNICFDMNLLNAAAKSSVAVLNKVLALAKKSNIQIIPTSDTLSAAVESGRPQLVNAVFQLAMFLRCSLPISQELFNRELIFI